MKVAIIINDESHAYDFHHAFDGERCCEERVQLLDHLIHRRLVIKVSVVLDSKQDRVEDDQQNDDLVESFVSDGPHDHLTEPVLFGEAEQGSAREFEFFVVIVEHALLVYHLVFLIVVRVIIFSFVLRLL